MATVFEPLENKSVRTGIDSLHNDWRDQIASLWMRWVFPTAGFEMYDEYGKNDDNVRSAGTADVTFQYAKRYLGPSHALDTNDIFTSRGARDPSRREAHRRAS